MTGLFQLLGIAVRKNPLDENTQSNLVAAMWNEGGNDNLRSDSRGFSLIELMISIAIIAVMSAIAFPTLQSLRARAKESEMRMHLAAIRTCEETYKSENDTYCACPAHPAIVPIAGNRVPWDNPPPPAEWNVIGFSADSPVLYQYSVINVVGGIAYTATAEGDVDCDSQTAIWRITPQSNYRPVWDATTDDH